MCKQAALPLLQHEGRPLFNLATAGGTALHSVRPSYLYIERSTEVWWVVAVVFLNRSLRRGMVMLLKGELTQHSELDVYVLVYRQAISHFSLSSLSSFPQHKHHWDVC